MVYPADGVPPKDQSSGCATEGKGNVIELKGRGKYPDQQAFLLRIAC